MRKTFIILMLMMFYYGFVNAQNTKYSIQGDFNMEVDPQHGDFIYKLTNVESNGIRFKQEGTWVGHETSTGLIMFLFREVESDCPCGLDSLKFWRWQTGIKQWQIDGEVIDGKRDFATNKDRTVIVVLDCSRSIGEEDFQKLKASARKFITWLSYASDEGNIHVGIVGFNSMKKTEHMVYPITPLSTLTKNRMLNFIDALELDYQTAYYYALDIALDMAENYNQLNAGNEFDGTSIISFTDGYDNVSKDASLGLPREGTENPYFIRVNQRLDGKIKGKDVENYVVAVQGNDVGNNVVFETVLKELASTNNHYFKLKNFNELESTFENIANNLVNRWQNLACFVPSSPGRVMWTRECGAKSKPLPPDEPKGDTRTPWLGISAEFGYCSDFLFGLNFDMAFSINKSFAVGARLGVISGSKKTEEYSYSYGGYYSYHESSSSKSFGFLIGPEVKFTYPENNALLVSCGPGLVNGNFAFFFRFGYKTKKPFFITAETLSDFDNFGGGIGIGWSFGGKTRKK